MILFSSSALSWLLLLVPLGGVVWREVTGLELAGEGCRIAGGGVPRECGGGGGRTAGAEGRTGGRETGGAGDSDLARLLLLPALFSTSFMGRTLWGCGPRGSAAVDACAEDGRAERTAESLMGRTCCSPEADVVRAIRGAVTFS